MSGHVELPSWVSLPFPEHSGNCSSPAAVGTYSGGERTAQVLHFPARKAADASVKPHKSCCSERPRRSPAFKAVLAFGSCSGEAKT